MNSGRLVPFEQSGAFFQRRAFICQDRGLLLEALGYMRKASQKEPANEEYQLDLAQLYTRMGCFDQSNRIIFRLLSKTEYPNECFFGMALNFMGLMEYDKAQEGFLAYLLAEPDGDFALDCEDMLDSLEMSPETTDDNWQLAMRGKAALDSGDVERAQRLLRRAVQKDPEIFFARNNLALALFLAGDTEEAIAETELVLSRDPMDIYALANMALFINSRHPGDPRVEECFGRAEQLADEEPEEISKLALTACALHWHERAYLLIQRILRMKPFDVEMLFYAGAAAGHLGRPEEALRYLQRALRIQPENTVVDYYLRELRQGHKVSIPYHMQVPEAEMIRRMRYLNEVVRSGSEATAHAYRQDESFRRFMWWGLEIPDRIFKRAIVNIASVLDAQDAQTLLKDFITRREENDEIKREAMGLLKQIGAPEPYLAYIDRQIVEVQVSVLDQAVHIPVAYERIARKVTEKLREGQYSDAAGTARRIWLSYINSYEERAPQIRSIQSWCAALMAVTLARESIAFDMAELCREWRTKAPLAEQHRQLILERIGDLDK